MAVPLRDDRFPLPSDASTLQELKEMAPARRAWELDDPWWAETGREQSFGEWCEFLASQGFVQVMLPGYGRVWRRQQ
jgi:hypothetical protein